MSTSTLLTIEDVDRMLARGDFDGPNAKRLELIRGELCAMSPIGTAHTDIVDWLTDWSWDVLDRRLFRASVQNPVEIPELATMPQPDLVWSQRKRSTRGRTRVPDIVLLIEVADTSVAYDTNVKAQFYAEAGVRDYWVVDIPDRKLHVFRDPSEQGFQTHDVHAGDARVVPLLIPNVSLTVSELYSELEADN